MLTLNYNMNNLQADYKDAPRLMQSVLYYVPHFWTQCL